MYSKGVNSWFLAKTGHFSPSFFFLGNIGQENFFCDVLERKNAFLGYKNKKLKKSKNCHFSKGVNPWFWPNNGHFSNFFLLGKIDQENVFYDILERKNALLGYKKKKLKKSKIDIFPKGLTNRFGPKMAIFWTSFFLGTRSQENVFYDILERKNAFLGFKNKTFKKSKRWHFSIGVNPWFRSKNGHFSNFFFLGNIGQEDVFYDILERKNAFLGYKHKSFKKSKNSHFFKGVNSWFWSKNGHFFYFFSGGNICQHFVNFFFLGKIGQENVFYDILERKNAFLAYKNKKFKKPKNCHYCKVVNPWFL